MLKVGGAVAFLLVLVLFASLVQSAQVVEVQQDQPVQEQRGFFGKIWDFATSPIAIGIYFFLVVITVLIVVSIFLVRWLIKYIKLRNDIFYKLHRERVFLAKTHRRYPAKHWYKVHKNKPIRIVKKIGDKVVVSRPIGFYRGDFISHEGNVVISMNLIGRKHWFVYPETECLIIPNRDSVKITRKDEKGNDISIIMENIPHAKDIVQFNEDEILLFVESISKVGHFLIPVVKAQDGKVIDLAMPVYQTLKEVIMENYLYDQTTEFVGLSKQAMNLNPHVRAIQKVGDAQGGNSGSIDVQPERI